jgi:plasmid stability protein
MMQITIRQLDPVVIEGLKKRAAEAGRSMEEEARKILSEAVLASGVAQQRAAVEKLIAARNAIFGQRVFPDSTGEIRKMRARRTRDLHELTPPPRRGRKT